MTHSNEFFDIWKSCFPGKGKHRGTLDFHGRNRAGINLVRIAGNRLTVKEIRFLQNFIH